MTKRNWETHKYLVIAPMRLDRGKNPGMIVRLMRGCLDADVSSHLVFCDFQSTGDDKVVLRNETNDLAKELRVADRVTFLSEFDAEAMLEVEHKTILDLIHPLQRIYLPLPIGDLFPDHPRGNA
jgi:hypothetical protein